MAPSLASTFRNGALALAVALTTSAQEDSGAQGLVFEFESATIDGQTNLIRAIRPTIVQDDLRIVADELLATSIEIDEASELRFTGNVRLKAGTAVIEADSAVFALTEERLSRGELVGAPVSFSDVGAATQTNITGNAQKMFYDNVARTLRLTGDVWMQRNRTEMRGCDIIYDFEAEEIRAGSADCGFRMRIPPNSDERAAAPDAPQ
jgi:lipopolysaccharide transport protein LptA